MNTRAACRLVPLTLLFLPLTGWTQQTQPAPVGPGYQGWGMPYYGHMWGGGMGYGWSGWGHVLFWLLLLGVGVLIYQLARRSGDSSHTSQRNNPNHSALQILNERYARGEIEKAEYEEKKAAIESGRR